MSRTLLVLSVFCFACCLAVSDDVCKADDKALEPIAQAAGTDMKAPAAKTNSRRILFFTAQWCGACQKMKKSEFPGLIEQNWKIGLKESDHIQIVDGDKHPELLRKYGVQFLPTLVLEIDGKVIDKRGYLPANDIAEMYYGRL